MQIREEGEKENKSEEREENDAPEENETRDNAGTHINTESRRQTHGQTNIGQQHSTGFSGPLSFLASRY